MIDELFIRNLGVIDQAVVELGPGLSVITGETGAGKTLLVTALSLLMGDKANASVVRPSCDEAVVSVRETDDNGEEIIFARNVSAAGRSKAYVNDAPVTLAELQRLVAEKLEISGQNTQQGLLRPSEQRDALDGYANIDTALLHEMRTKLERANAELNTIVGDPKEVIRELELLKFQIKELDAANIVNANEDDDLASKEQLLANSVGLREKSRIALELLDGEGGAYESISSALVHLKSESAFSDSYTEFTGLVDTLRELVRDLKSSVDSISDDPSALQEVQERRAVLTQLRRKYGEHLADVMEFHRKVAERIAYLENLEVKTSELREHIKSLTAEVANESAKVRNKREEAARPMAKKIAEVLKTLALPHAQFEVELDDSPAGDGIVLLFSANPGMKVAPLSKVASGGELSRVMLAIRLVSLNENSGSKTLVFDEVDAGIGGEAAVAVARALATLAQKNQVLLVTHLPQIAAYGDRQIVVEKVVTGNSTSTDVSVVHGDNRIVELSRMLSGQPESSNANLHAAELLDLAEEERKKLAKVGAR